MRGVMVIGLVVAALSLVAPAHASHISCGQTITADTVLDSDLTCATQSALIVATPDVTIDLNGHQIVAGNASTSSWGIRAHTDRTTVTNGVIRGFDTAGVQISGDGAVIEGVTFRDNHTGIELIQSERGSVKDNEFDRNHQGVSLFTSDGSRAGGHVVEGNVFTGDGSRFESGVMVHASTGNRIEGNTMTGVVNGIFLNGAVGTRVANNRIEVLESADAQTGVDVFGLEAVSNNVIVDNEIRGGQIGLWYSSTGTGGRVAGNTITASDIGIYWDITAVDMRIEDNTIDQPRFTGIYLTWQESNPHPEHHLTVARNRITGSGDDGIYVEENPGQTLLQANLVSGSADDGIETRPFDFAEAPQPALVKDNSTWSNGDWGITAASPASDGGGNRAWSNGQAAQCFNVVCGPGGPATLTLEPKTATNTVGDRHCVTTAVADHDGRAAPGVTVRFSVDPGDAGGSAETDAEGQARFCYEGPIAPRTDTITAYADGDADGIRDEGEPGDEAAKSWVVPASSRRCTVSGWGRFTAANGDTARFMLFAWTRSPIPSLGFVSYADHGPATPLLLFTIRISRVVCTGSTATILGRAWLWPGTQHYRIDVADNGVSGDRFRLRLSGGHDSGDRPLMQGGVQVR